MPRPLQAEKQSPESEYKAYSCLACRQRKVKCDRRTPSCSNCTKAEKQCSFVAPVRGKRTRTKPPRESLHAKLKRYEELLRSYGAKVETPEDFHDDDSEMLSQSGVETNQEANPTVLQVATPKFITKGGTSRYFESALWSDLGDQHPEVGGLVDPGPESTAHGSDLILAEINDKKENLTNLYPSLDVLHKLKALYIDRVDPLMKVLHIPTFWRTLLDGLRQPQTISESLEALIFVFCLGTVMASTEEECQSLFGAPQSVVFSRYRATARQALINAEFLSTANLTTLQAFALYLICLRNHYRCDTLYVLSGVAVRLGRKMGLHRDGTTLGLSPFETEMRRRLWWNLVHMDFRTADVVGARPSLDLLDGDAKYPLNVHDEDLHEDMANLPPERKDITPITLCSLKCEIMETLRKFSTASQEHVRWEILYSTDITLAKKNSIISQTEDLLETKYLRYCDPSNTLHTFASIMVRSVICKMKLFAYNPGVFAKSPVKISQSDRDVVFTNARKLLEYLTIVQDGAHGLKKYMWHAGTSHLWNTMLYMLIETRHRKTAPEVEKVWPLIGVVFSQYPQVFEDSSGLVFSALRKWTLEVWDEYVAAFRDEGQPEPDTPDYIHAIRRCRRPAIGSMNNTQHTALKSGVDNSTTAQRCEGDIAELEFSSYDFPNLLSFELDPNEWVQWEQMVAGQGDFAQI